MASQRRSAGGTQGRLARLQRARARATTGERYTHPRLISSIRAPQSRTSIARRIAHRSAVTTPKDREERRAARLTAWGTLIAGAAAAVGLLFSAGATYFSATTVRDQEKQSHEQYLHDRQNQALHIGFWYDNRASQNDDVATLSNRSPDAIYEVTVEFTYPVLPKHVTEGTKVAEKTMSYYLPNVGPCTRLIFTRKSLHASFDRGAGGGVDVEQPTSVSITFRDAQGVRWQRGLGLREVGAMEPFGLDSTWASRLKSGQLALDIDLNPKSRPSTQPDPYCTVSQ